MRDISDIIGNIRSGVSTAHAYIVEGRAGSARDRFIESLIAGLGCHPMDIVRMQMSGKDSYKTDDANAFAQRLDMGAYGSFLCGIVDDADALSEIVQNKLLKTLEEPRDSVLIFLGTSNRDHLLDTVRSRCSVIRAQDYTEDAEGDAGRSEEAVRRAAELMLDPAAPFCEFRDAAEKCVKTRPDALSLIDCIEDLLRGCMLRASGASSGRTAQGAVTTDGLKAYSEPAVCAAALETAEKARMDIGRDMDKNKALKRLRLELPGR